MQAKLDERLGWQNAYGVNGDAAFADVENDTAVVGTDIQIGEGLDLLAGADAPVAAVKRAACLCRHWCHGPNALRLGVLGDA